jgi:uncharacterized protein RhaS with RHS repeats
MLDGQQIANQYSYDKFGNLTYKKDPDGNIAEFAYDYR